MVVVGGGCGRLPTQYDTKPHKYKKTREKWNPRKKKEKKKGVEGVIVGPLKKN